MRLNNTIQRRTILAELQKINCHPTAEELFQLVHLRLPRISLGTVYRNLAVLEKEGFVRRIECYDRTIRYDAHTAEHSHLRCTHCGRVEDIVLTDDQKNMVHSVLQTVLQDRVHGFSLDFSGFCRDCQERIGSDSV